MSLLRMFIQVLMVCIVLGFVACASPRPEASPSAPMPQSPALAPSASGAECTADEGCRSASDYCGGCGCRPLPRDAVLPKCSGRAVACFVDPCRSARAVCRNGHCELAKNPDM